MTNQIKNRSQHYEGISDFNLSRSGFFFSAASTMEQFSFLKRCIELREQAINLLILENEKLKN
jgi:hypothetical protein